MKMPNWLSKLLKSLKASNPKPFPPVDPVPAPVPVAGPVNWRTQQLFAGVNYFWSGLDWNSICPRLKALGFTGVHCELMELVTTGSLREQQAKQIRMLKSVAEACRQHGLILMVANNSNDKLNAGGGMTVDLMRERLEQLKNFVGTEGVLLQAMSENDGNTDVKVREFARAWARQNWPADQIAHYGVVTGSGFREEHSANVAVSSPGWNMLFVTDNSSGRVEQMISDEYVAQAKYHIYRGNSFAIYGFHDKPDWPAWEAIGKAFRERDNTVIELKPVDDTSAFINAQGWSEGGRKLPSLSSIQPTTFQMTGGEIRGEWITFSHANPFGEGAMMCLIWNEAAGWFWCDVEGMHANQLRQNYARNLFPVAGDSKKPGRCLDAQKVAHYPRRGAQVWGFIWDRKNVRRTPFVYLGTQP